MTTGKGKGESLSAEKVDGGPRGYLGALDVFGFLVLKSRVCPVEIEISSKGFAKKFRC